MLFGDKTRNTDERTCTRSTHTHTHIQFALMRTLPLRLNITVGQVGEVGT